MHSDLVSAIKQKKNQSELRKISTILMKLFQHSAWRNISLVFLLNDALIQEKRVVYNFF